MKSILTSFLFFCLIICSKLGAQEILNDSVSYYNNIIKNPKNSDQLISSYIFYKRRKDNSERKKDTLNTIYSLYYLAKIQEKSGAIYDSEASAIEALELLDNKSVSANEIKLVQWLKKNRLSLYNHLGITCRNLFRYEKALYYYNEALKISETKIEIAKVYGNKGFVYSKMGKLNLAIIEYKEALNLIKGLKDERLEARLLDNLGDMQSKLNYPAAIDNLEKALQIRNKIKYNQGLVSSYTSISNHYYRLNNRKLASYYIEKALKITDKSKNPRHLQAVISNMIDQGNYTRVSQYKKITDSIRIADLNNNTKYSEAKYNYTQQKKIAEENEIKLKVSRLNEEIEKSKRITYQGLAVLILMLTIFIIIKLVDKHKKDKIKEAYRKETELSKKVHDELANDMSDLMSFVENDIEVTTNKKSLLLDNIEDIYLRTRDISTKTASIDLIHFRDSLSNLLLQHNKTGTKVVINDINTINWKKVPDHKKMVVYRCLQELMVNMKKHSQAKLVSLVFKEKKAKKEIHYVDDGIGFSTENTKFNGLANVESRIKGIGGSFNFTTSEGNGFKATLKFNS